jgi:adenosylcobinamide-GDP ribazoletransferase
MESADETSLPGARDAIFEAVLAVAALTLWPILDERSQGSAAQRSRAAVYFPIVGFALGVILAIADRTAALAAGPAGRSFIVLIVAAALSLGLTTRGVADTVEALRRGTRPASTGLARIGPLGAAAAVAAFAFEVWCWSQITDDAGRAGAIVMAMTLSRWAIVPIGYGLKPLERWGLGIPYEGGISFREFSVSSAIALGLTMALYQNVGLAVIVVLALTILAMRLVLSRRLGGASGYMLAGGCAIVELVAFAAMAALRASSRFA